MQNTDEESIGIKNKSIRIMSELETYLFTGRMGVDSFPKADILNMLREVYMERIRKKELLLQSYLEIYSRRMEAAIESQDEMKLSELLKELILDMQNRLPIKVQDDRVHELIEDYWIEEYKKYVKMVYAQYQYRSMSGKRIFRGKGVIYTVITGQYDELKDPLYIDSAFDYVCFTDDRSVKSEVWEIRYIEGAEEQKLDKVRLARKYKILCHEFLKEYDYSVYVDGKIHIIGDMNKYIDQYSMGSSMLCFPHFKRDCAYEEANTCISCGNDRAEIIEKQMERYKQEGYPLKNGLIDSACLVRVHNDRILQRVMECWWEEIKENSRRDQISIGYVCWKNNFHYDICDLFIYDNEFICKERAGELSY